MYTVKLHLVSLIIYSIMVYLPLILLAKYMSNIPYIPYYFLVSMFAYKLFTEDEKSYQKNITPSVTNFLYKMTGKKPSQQNVFNLVLLQSRVRDFLFFSTIFMILILGILFNLF